MENDIKIKIILRDSKSNLLANANISINTIQFGFVTIKGFQIWKSHNLNERLQESINITPPTRQVYGHYRFQVFFEDKTKWPIMEEMIYNAFLQIRNKRVETEDVDIDELPDDLSVSNQ